MRQTNFFEEYPQKYPNAPGFAKNRKTSKDAAHTVWNPTARQKLIMTALETHGGLTDHELSKICNLPMCVIQPRRSDLSALKKVIDSGQRRLTPYGKEAIVWKVR